MPDWTATIRAALTAEGRAPDADVVEELTQHAAATYETARADGRSHEDAVAEVDGLLSSWCRDALALRKRPRHPPAVEPPDASRSRWSGLAQDVRYAFRLLRRQPGFAALAIATTALGIGATTALFSVAYGVLLKPLPWPDADRLVRLTETRQGRAGRIRGTISNATYNAWYSDHSTIEEIAGFQGVSTNTATTLSGMGEPIRVQRAIVTPTLFTVLKGRPLRGRLFVADDGVPGGRFKPNDVVIISYGLWREQFGGVDEAVGRIIQLDGRAFSIVGVMPPDFAFPDRTIRMWTPFAVPAVAGGQNVRSLAIFGGLARLRPGVTIAQAAAEGTSRARGAPDPGLTAIALFGANGPPEIAAAPALEAMTAEVRPAITVLLCAVALLLVTATANVASLQLARATTRRREIAIRAALGAGLARISRQLLLESALLSVAGAVIGVALAAAITHAAPAVLPADFPRVADISLNLPVLLFAAALALVTGAAFGVLPVLHAGRLNLAGSLTEGGLAAIGGDRSGVARTRMLIMAGQIALTCVLLVGAAVLTRSFVALLHADRGYDPTQLLTARLPLPAAYPAARRTALVDALLQRLREVPGVSRAAVGNALPLVSAGGFRAFKMRSARDSTEVDAQAMDRIVSPEYFAAMSLRLVAGRTLTDADVATSRPVVVVNRSFAQKYLSDRAVGDTIPVGPDAHRDSEVIGIVEDMRQGDVTDAPQPEMFRSYRQATIQQNFDPIFILKMSGDPAAHAATLRALVRAEDPAVALDSVMTMEDRLVTSLAKPRLYALLMSGFAAFALAIAGVGLFGVLSYSVARRAREIGVRTALGATSRHIVTLVLKQALVITVAGVAAGVWTSFALLRYLSAFLYGVTAHDAVSFIVVPIVLASVAAMACVVPARRAARIDPLRALRAG
jgi:predicted permease